jgi:hypothetical protein
MTPSVKPTAKSEIQTAPGSFLHCLLTAASIFWREMDSWPRVALLVDVAAAAELCERFDDSLLGCLQLVREIQSENGGKDIAFR